MVKTMVRPMEGYSVACGLGKHSACSGAYGRPIATETHMATTGGPCKCECHADVREGYGG